MNRHLVFLYVLVLILTAIIVSLVFEFNPLVRLLDPAVKNTSVSEISPTDPAIQSAVDKASPGSTESAIVVNRIESQACQKGKFMTGIQGDGTILCEFVPGSTPPGSQLECYGHGFIENGFCTCDDGWTGPECQDEKPLADPNAPPDKDGDNHFYPADCDDNDDMVYPGAPDSVDGKDNDCDGEVDEGY